VGLFDDIFQELAVTLVDLFVDGSATWTRSRATYDFLADEENVLGGIAEDTWSVKIGVPEMASQEVIDREGLQSGDLQVLVPLLNLPLIDDVRLVPDQKTDHVIAASGDRFRLVKSVPLATGDSAAGYTLFLRRGQ
jgi:hypothetical protein